MKCKVSRLALGAVAGVLCLASQISWPREAAAYSLENHEKLTRAAVKRLNACRVALAPPGATPEVLDERLTGTLIACNLGQDRVLKKLTVWHFYSPAGPPKGGLAQANFVAADTRLDDWFGQLAAATASPTLAPDQAYGLTGAAIHYLQDVTTPPHVIPVFHPTALTGSDNFDDYPFEEEPVSATRVDCRRLLETPGDLPTLLASTAAETKAALASPLTAQATSEEGGTRPVQWEIFWDPAIGKNGFGRYGCAGDSFGQPLVKCHGSELRISQDVYRSFARARHTAALEATVRALAIIQRTHGGAPVQPVAACPLPERTHDKSRVRLQWVKMPTP